MKQLFTIIVIIIIVGALGYLAYRMIFKKPADGTPCSTTGGSINDGTIVNGECVKNAQGNGGLPPAQEGNTNINPALLSSEIHSGSAMPAQNPNGFFGNVHKSNLSSFNLLTSPGSNPSYVHFTVPFSNQCSQFIWYKHWLYTFTNSKTDSSTGSKTCYYKVDKSVFPNSISVIIPNGTQCDTYKLFLSGVEYKYSGTKTVTQALSAPITYCDYQKQ